MGERLKKKAFLVPLPIAAWMLMSLTNSLGQVQIAERRDVEWEPGNCEWNLAGLDSVRSKALQELGEEDFLIMVARLGDGETSQTFSNFRLQSAKAYLSGNGLPADKIITAAGERVKGYGRVEFYIKGSLAAAILTKRNTGICTECCNPRPEDFTNHRKRRRRAK